MRGRSKDAVFLVSLGLAAILALSFLLAPVARASTSPSPTPSPLVDYWVTVSAGSGGTISGGSGFTTPGTSYTYTITPDEGYRILDVTDNGVSVGAVYTYQLTDIHENHEIIATFSPIASASTPTPSPTVSPSPASTPTPTTTPTPSTSPTSPPDIGTPPEVYYAIAAIAIAGITTTGAVLIKRQKK